MTSRWLFLCIVHNGKGEDNPPSPDQVGETAQKRGWLRHPHHLKSLPCCCKARADFKEGIDNVEDLSRKDKGRAPKKDRGSNKITIRTPSLA